MEEPKKRVRRSRFDQPEERKRKHSPNSSDTDRYVREGKGICVLGRENVFYIGANVCYSFQGGGYYEAPAKISKQDDEPSWDANAVLLSWCKYCTVWLSLAIKELGK